MACPFFEPTNPATTPTHAGARLPLIHEYDGICHVTGQGEAVPLELRFRCCNRGYSSACCPRFPEDGKASCMRFSVRSESEGVIRILCIEELDHTPVRWYEAQFEIASGLIRGDYPMLERIQAEAFGRSYLACGPAK